MKLLCPICNKEFISKGDNKRCSKECYNIYKSLYMLSGDLIRDSENNLFCIKCKSYKKEEEFYNRNDYENLKYRNFKSTICKKCQTVKNKIVTDRYRETVDGTLRENLRRAKNSCKKRQLEYNIDLNYIRNLYKSQDGKCALSGVALEPFGYYNSSTISIDRIDSTKGYIIGNIQLVCWVVNQMKNDLSIKELINWCNSITEYNIKNK